MRAGVQRDQLLVALKRAIEVKFSASDWKELGHLTGCSERLDAHPRLYRSLSFGDDDYGACVLTVLPWVLGDNLENAELVADFVGLEAWLKENDPSMLAKLFGGSIALGPEHLASLKDPGVIEDHLRRLSSASATDPEHAIGVAKELIESTAKLVLDAVGEAYDERVELPALVKAVQEALRLHPAALAPTAKGVESTRKVLGGLTSIAIGVTELRNLYGTGHGKSARVTGLSPRHAQLAVDAASTYCRALLATLADPEAPWRKGRLS